MQKESDAQPCLWHVVLISFHDQTPEETQREVYNLYQTLAEDCGGVEADILFFRVDWNLDTRKGVQLVQIAVYRDNEALQAFRVHPAHHELTNILREVADWQVGDVNLPFIPTGL